MREIAIEGSWESRLPTTLTILQKESALIQEEGLPCCDKVKLEGYTNTLIPDYEKLSLKKEKK